MLRATHCSSLILGLALCLALCSCGGSAAFVGSWVVDVEATKAEISAKSTGIRGAALSAVVGAVRWADCRLELKEDGAVEATAQIGSQTLKRSGRWKAEGDQLILTEASPEDVRTLVGTLDRESRILIQVRAQGGIEVPVILVRAPAR